MLHDTDLVAEGGERWVYQSTDYPEYVFKLQKPVHAREAKNTMKERSIRWFPRLADRIVHREYAAYLRACLAPQGDVDTLPINRLYGFAKSNLGLMQVSEKVSLDGMTIGPTIKQLHNEGTLGEERLELLSDFANAFLHWGIPTNDISRQNVVLGRRNGREIFLAVEGFGDIKIIPTRSHVQFVRRRALVRRLDRIATRIGREFDPATFRFR